MPHYDALGTESSRPNIILPHFVVFNNHKID